MGDAGIETFEKLKSCLPANITVLKVGHHGAAGVVNKNMARYLNPEFCIVSTGENKFGHPSVYTLETLSASRVLRTDKDNAIKITVNKDYKITAYDNKKRKFVSVK